MPCLAPTCAQFGRYILHVLLTLRMRAAATNTAVAEVHSLAGLTAPEISYAPASKAPVKKRGAVIGSAPQLNSQGLMAAAELAKEKEVARLKQVRSNSETGGRCYGWSMMRWSVRL